MHEGIPSPERLTLKQGSRVRLKLEAMSPELIAGLLDKNFDIEGEYRVFYLSEGTAYIGPRTASRQTVLAYEPGKDSAEGSVLPISRSYLEVSTNSWH